MYGVYNYSFIGSKETAFLKVHTSQNLVDPFTKYVPYVKHDSNIEDIRLHPSSNFLIYNYVLVLGY